MLDDLINKKYLDNDSRIRRGLSRQRRLTVVGSEVHRGKLYAVVSVEERVAGEHRWVDTHRKTRVLPTRLRPPYYLPAE